MRPHTLRVMSLNLWNDRGDVTQRLQAALAAIKLLDVDAIGLQEVREAHGGLRQAQQIAAALDAKSIFAAADARSPSGAIGNAVVSRLPMRLLGETMLPADGRDPRVAVAVELQTRYGAFCFVTTHLTWEMEASPIRERQVVALDAFARPFARSLPSVMTGDFNASPDADAIRFLTGRKSLDGQGTYWRDAWARIHPHDDGYTWSARNPQVVRLVERNRRIDYIFVGPLADDGRGAIVDARVVLDQPDKDGVFPSDHFAVFAEIALEPVEEPK
jgi:endonuclease/exonuclease/phosphatase family metal-dependent hydrolase